MIIRSGSIAMESARRYSAKSMQGNTALFGWVQQSGGAGGKSFRSALAGKEKRRRVEAQIAANGGLAGRYTSVAGTMKKHLSAEASSIEQIRKQTLYYILQRLHAIFYGTKEKGRGGMSAGGYDAGGQAFSYTEYASFEEREETSFQTGGKVVTADGREISFHVSLEMSRRFSAYYEKTHTIETAPVLSLCDPLVINLNDNIAEVSDQKICFDLDADGQEDSIARLSAGSGFLALDRNGDGTVNDGSELFGTGSGDGFADLAAYDADGNGWIDEADPVFEKLKIWVMDEKGGQKLYRLKEKGVGAICLASASTDFDLRSLEDDSLNGRIRKTGVFLYENGSVGTVQHVDLAK